MADLSLNNQKIYSFIVDFTNTHNQAPTLEEIKDHFGYASLTSVQRAITFLEKNDYIRKAKHKMRGISIPKSEIKSIPLVGVVACGTPMLAVENIDSYIPTDTNLIKGNYKEYFYLRASGDSMDKAGIKDGDLVLIKSQPTANDGEIVVALINDNATIKIIKHCDGIIALMPNSSNSKHKPIILREDFAIQGVVVKVLSL